MWAQVRTDLENLLSAIIYPALIGDAVYRAFLTSTGPDDALSRARAAEGGLYYRMIFGFHLKGNSPTPSILAIHMANHYITGPCRLGSGNGGTLCDNVQPILALVAVLLCQEATDIVPDIRVRRFRSNS